MLREKQAEAKAIAKFNDREPGTLDYKFTIIIPKFDNHERKIKTEEIERVANAMSAHFKGVTMDPTVGGCWNPGENVTEDGDSSEPISCEENTEIYSCIVRAHTASSKSVVPPTTPNT